MTTMTNSIIDLLVLLFAIAVPYVGFLIGSCVHQRRSRAYGRYLLARKLSQRGYAAAMEIREAQRLERAKSKGRKIMRTWRKTVYR